MISSRLRVHVVRSMQQRGLQLLNLDIRLESPETPMLIGRRLALA